MKITQYGTDGFGHQLFGIISLIAATNNTENTEYVPYLFIRQFEHVSTNEGKWLNDYIVEIYKQIFNYDHKQLKIYHSPRMHNNFNSSEMKNTSDLVSFDNAFSFSNIGILMQHTCFQHALFNNKLPNPEFQSAINVVVHIRGGDGSKRKAGSDNTEYIMMLNKVLGKIYSEYSESDLHIYVHSNSNAAKFEEINPAFITYFCGDTQVLFAFSQMLHATILIAGDSSLSLCACYGNKNKLIIFPDQCTCHTGRDAESHPRCVYENSTSFSKYIQSEKPFKI